MTDWSVSKDRKIDWTKKIGHTMRSEACVVEMNLFGEDGRYVRHKYIADNPLPVYEDDKGYKKTYYHAVCQRCKKITFIKPLEFFIGRP